MTIQPRLRDDPALRDAFADLDALLERPERDPLPPPPIPKPPPPRPVRARGRLAAIMGATAAALVALWALWPSPAPINGEIPTAEPLASPATQVDPPGVRAPDPVPSVDIQIERTRRPLPAVRPGAKVEPAQPSGDPTPSQSARPPAQPSQEPHDPLAEELALFHSAEDALDRGDSAEAIAILDAYAGAFPAGRLLDEAELLRLSALIVAGDWAAAESLAASLSVRPDLAPRQSEILVFRARILAGLGRCDEALALVRELPRRQSAIVRESCH